MRFPPLLKRITITNTGGSMMKNVIVSNQYKPFAYPDHSEWSCQLFGTGKNGLLLRPKKGDEPNWFWRKMQYLILGNKWVKDGAEKVEVA